MRCNETQWDCHGLLNELRGKQWTRVNGQRQSLMWEGTNETNLFFRSVSCFSWSLELSKGVPHSLTPSLAPSLSSCFLLLLLLRLLTASSFCQLVVTTNGPEPERKLRMQLGTPGPEPYPDQDAWYLSQAPDEHMPERMPKMPERVVEKTYFATFFPQKWPEMTPNRLLLLSRAHHLLWDFNGSAQSLFLQGQGCRVLAGNSPKPRLIPR